MVSYPNILASNARISSELPVHVVAVFIGATSGIGELSVKSFAKNVNQPRIYIVGRSQESADRIIAECKTLNPKGEYFFLKTDASLIKNVDEICREIKSKEKSINVLFNSMGTLQFGTSMSLY
jgi:short-subunit dehydrogenase